MNTVTRLSLLAAAALLVALPAPVLAAPTVNAPVAKFLTGSGLGSSTMPVRVYWSGSGVTSYTVQQSTDSGAWANVALSSATATSVSRSLYSGHYYQFRVQGVDSTSTSSGWVAGPKFRALAFQETSGYISFSSSWYRRSMSGAYGGYLKTTTAGGATVSFTFSGRSVAWVAPMYWSAWKADVYVDGAFITNVDLWRGSGSELYRRVVFARNWGTYATHTLKIRASGNVSPYHPNVDVDAILTLK